mmetsp:Transcript_81079/g.262038  ORF Transcript_81079/g.262038 Transcript_81079/m.262038 type:complete len:278 (-) Transcript_81079:378-1211(-)
MTSSRKPHMLWPLRAGRCWLVGILMVSTRLPRSSSTARTLGTKTHRSTASRQRLPVSFFKCPSSVSFCCSSIAVLRTARSSMACCTQGGLSSSAREVSTSSWRPTRSRSRSSFHPSLASCGRRSSMACRLFQPTTSERISSMMCHRGPVQLRGVCGRSSTSGFRSVSGGGVCPSCPTKRISASVSARPSRLAIHRIVRWTTSKCVRFSAGIAWSCNGSSRLTRVQTCHHTWLRRDCGSSGVAMSTRICLLPPCSLRMEPLMVWQRSTRHRFRPWLPS